MVTTITTVTTFAALAEPNRRHLVSLLRDDELPVGSLVERSGMSQPSVSKHLRVLREAGLVAVRRDAQQRWYRLRLEPFVEADQWLAPFIQVWNERLDALESRLDDMDDMDDVPAQPAAPQQPESNDDAT